MSDASVREECAAILEMPIANQIPRETVRRIARACLQLQKRLDASEQTIQQLRSVADKLAELLGEALKAVMWVSGPSHEMSLTISDALAQYAEIKLASSKDPDLGTGAVAGAPASADDTSAEAKTNE